MKYKVELVESLDRREMREGHLKTFVGLTLKHHKEKQNEILGLWYQKMKYVVAVKQ